MKIEWEEGPPGAVQRLRYELAGMPDSPALLRTVCQLLPELIECDDAIWHSADDEAWCATIYDQDGTERYGDEVGERLLEATDSPVRIHYLSQADPDGRPVRIGDISSDRQFRNTSAWVDLYRPLDISRQLTIPTSFNVRTGPRDNASMVTGGTAWSLNRNGPEFTDHDLATAKALQPLLQALEATAMSDPKRGRAKGSRMCSAGRETSLPERGRPTPPRGQLTAREVEVLSLVARGLTAISIGYRLGISASTVRKHLEHIYEKTGQRDRLLAVTFAQRSGLLHQR